MLQIQKLISEAKKTGRGIDMNKYGIPMTLKDMLTIFDELKKLGVDSDAPLKAMEQLSLNEIMELYSVSQKVAEEMLLYIHSFKLCMQILTCTYDPPKPGETRVLSGNIYSWKKQ